MAPNGTEVKGYGTLMTQATATRYGVGAIPCCASKLGRKTLIQCVHLGCPSASLRLRGRLGEGLGGDDRRASEDEMQRRRAEPGASTIPLRNWSVLAWRLRPSG